MSAKVDVSMRVKPSVVQQDFGLVVDRTMAEGGVVVERYGVPKVAIVEYGCYQHLVEAGQALLRSRLQQAAMAASSRAACLSDEEAEAPIERARSE